MSMIEMPRPDDGENIPAIRPERTPHRPLQRRLCSTSQLLARRMFPRESGVNLLAQTIIQLLVNCVARTVTQKCSLCP
jgi:hypothetical protein